MTSSTPSKSEEVLDFWQRRERLMLLAAPFVLLALCCGVDAGSRGGHRGGVLVALGASVAAAAWMGLIVRADRRESWLEPMPFSRLAGVIGMTVLVALSTVLVLENSLYGFYVWTGYIWAYRLLPGRLRVFGVAVNAIPVAISQTGGGAYTDAGAIFALVAVWLVNTVIANLFTWFGSIGEEREQHRVQEVSELTRANAALAESLRENAELHERLVGQARATGVVDERRRMAREIHDTLAQGLMGIITQLQAAAGGVTDPAAERRISSAIELARESLTEARRSVAALAPEQLVGARLPDAVRDVAERWSALNDTPVELTTTGALAPTPPAVELALLRTAQEALANVAKHARATRVGLTLSYMEDVVTLDVRDDGCGFTPAHAVEIRQVRGAEQGGFGLGLMRERIEGVAGRLAVESEPDAGTAISAAVPLNRPAAPALMKVSA